MQRDAPTMQHQPVTAAATGAAASLSVGVASHLGMHASIPVSFVVPHCQLADGDHLRVVGACPALGAWQVDAAPALQWRHGHCWVGALALPPGSHTFKLVVVRADGSAAWEAGTDRALRIPELAGASAGAPPLLTVTCTRFGATEETALAVDRARLQVRPPALPLTSLPPVRARCRSEALQGDELCVLVAGLGEPIATVHPSTLHARCRLWRTRRLPGWLTWSGARLSWRASWQAWRRKSTRGARSLLVSRCACVRALVCGPCCAHIRHSLASPRCAACWPAQRKLPPTPTWRVAPPHPTPHPHRRLKAAARFPRCSEYRIASAAADAQLVVDANLARQHTQRRQRAQRLEVAAAAAELRSAAGALCAPAAQLAAAAGGAFTGAAAASAEGLATVLAGSDGSLQFCFAGAAAGAGGGSQPTALELARSRLATQLPAAAAAALERRLGGTGAAPGHGHASGSAAGPAAAASRTQGTQPSGAPALGLAAAAGGAAAVPKHRLARQVNLLRQEVAAGAKHISDLSEQLDMLLTLGGRRLGGASGAGSTRGMQAVAGTSPVPRHAAAQPVAAPARPGSSPQADSGKRGAASAAGSAARVASAAAAPSGAAKPATLSASAAPQPALPASLAEDLLLSDAFVRPSFPSEFAHAHMATHQQGCMFNPAAGMSLPW